MTEQERNPSGYLKRVCTSCGYIYDPVAGDGGHGIPPNTPFDRLPDDWKCPLCYAAKEAFDLL